MIRKIEAILFEPVGCLAEFPAEPFHEIAVRFFGRAAHKPVSKSASRAYWHLLNLLEAGQHHGAEIVAWEVRAGTAASVYEDVRPALTELREMGVKLCIASSLSAAAVACFLEKNALQEFFAVVTNRENAKGLKSVPLTRTMANADLAPEHSIFLTDTLEGLKAGNEAGVPSVLMMNDPDEARRLAMPGAAGKPAGGIVSLHELPDFVRLVAAKS